jgi:hypothetical protein
MPKTYAHINTLFVRLKNINTGFLRILQISSANKTDCHDITDCYNITDCHDKTDCHDITDCHDKTDCHDITDCHDKADCHDIAEILLKVALIHHKPSIFVLTFIIHIYVVVESFP